MMCKELRLLSRRVGTGIFTEKQLQRVFFNRFRIQAIHLFQSKLGNLTTQKFSTEMGNFATIRRDGMEHPAIQWKLCVHCGIAGF